MAPLMMPERPNGSTAMRIISQRVAPSASAASSCSVGRLQEDLAGHRGDDRQDHHRQHDARGEHGAAGGRRPGRRTAGSSRGSSLEPLVSGTMARRELQRAPQAVDDAGDGGEQVDDVAERLREPPRRVVGDEQRDPDGERGRDDQRDRPRRAACRTPAARRRRRSPRRRDRPIARCDERRQRLDEQEDRDAGEDDEDEDAGARREAGEDAVARPLDRLRSLAGGRVAGARPRRRFRCSQ